MSRRDPLVRVRHMHDHAVEAIELARGRSRADLESDRVLSLALVRLMEIIGEAAARVADDFREAHPSVPWRAIADFRNRLIHGYDTVDHDILWTIVQKDLEPLVIELARILKAH